jgi:hypothetical protein
VGQGVATGRAGAAGADAWRERSTRARRTLEGIAVDDKTWDILDAANQSASRPLESKQSSPDLGIEPRPVRQRQPGKIAWPVAHGQIVLPRLTSRTKAK